MSNRDTRLVIEDDTVYELDLDCLRNRKKKKPPCPKREKKDHKRTQK